MLRGHAHDSYRLCTKTPPLASCQQPSFPASTDNVVLTAHVGCCTADLHDVKVWQAHTAADKAAAAAAAAADDAAADKAEALLEQQLDLMLEEEALADGDGLVDDYMDSDGTSSSDDANGNDVTANPASKQTSSTSKQQPLQQHGQQKRAAGKQGGGALPGPVAEAPPPSFSQVQLGLPEAELRQRFPRFPGLAAASVVVLQAGDMLYLPAGWFHEVTSYGGPGQVAAGGKEVS